MTDEGSVAPPVTESVPVPEVAPAPVIPPEAVKEISQEITEAVQDVIVQDPVREPAASNEAGAPTPEPPAAAPAASSSTVMSQPAPKSSNRGHMLAVVRARKAERLEKIVALARERKFITNDDVEKLLKVSDSTAARYLSELATSNRLKRSGAKKHEHYEPL